MATDPYADLTDEQLGQKVKAKFKGAYDDLADADLGKKMRAKVTAGPISVGGMALDQPEEQVAAKRAAGEQSIAEAKKTLTSTLPIAGATVGTALLTGGASLPAQAAAAGFGAAGGEAYRQLANRALGLEAPSTGGEAAGSMLKEALTQGGMQGAMGLGVGVAQKVLKPYGKAMLNPENVAVWQTAEKHGMNLTAAEVTQGRLSKFIQKWVDNSTFGGGASEARKKVLNTQLEGAVEGAMQRFGAATEPRATGGALMDGVKAARLAWHDQAAKGFDALRKQYGLAEVSMEQPLAVAYNLKDSVAGLRQKFPDFLKDLTPEEQLLDKFITGAAGKEEGVATLGFGDAMKLRSLLREKGRDFMAKGDRQAKKLMDTLSDSVDEAINSAAATQGGPQAEKAIKDARQFYKEGLDLFEETAVADMFSKDPEKFVASIRRDDVSKIGAVKKALSTYGKQDVAWDTFRRQYTQNLLKDANGNLISDFKMLKNNLDSMSPEAKKLVFDDATGQTVLKNLEELSTVANRVGVGSKPQVANPSDLLLLSSALYFQHPVLMAAGGAKVFIPPMLTRILNNPVATKKLLQGFAELPKSTTQFLANTERAIDIAMKGKKSLDLLYEGRELKARAEEQQRKQSGPSSDLQPVVSH